MESQNNQITKEDVTSIVTTAINTAIEASETRMLNAVGQMFVGVTERLDGMDERLMKVESTMVTKDYLDEKMSDLRGDLVVMTRNEDNKVNALVDALVAEKAIKKETGQKILAMEPFPR